MSDRWRGEQGRGGRRRLAVLALVVLLVVDVALIALALSAARGSAGDDGSSPAATFAAPTQTPTESPTPSDTPEPSTPPSEPVAATGERLLAASGDGVLWRAQVGSCEVPGSVEVSSDDGATWAPVTLAGATPTQILTFVTGPDTRQASVIFADQTCAVQAQRTFTAGAAWQDNAPVLGVSSYVLPDGGVVTAGVSIEAPCEAPLQARGAQALLCADGLYVGGDGAWQEPVPNVVAIAPLDAQTSMTAAVGDPSCAGIALARVLLADAAVQPVACVDAAPSSDVAVAVDEASAFVWTGGDVIAVPFS